MAHGDVVADGHVQAGIGVEDAVVLNVGAFADHNGHKLRAGDGTKEEAALLAHGHVAEDGGVGGDEGGGVDVGRFHGRYLT